MASEAERYAMYIDQDNGIIHGVVKVDGNLEVYHQLAAREFKVVDENQHPILTTAGDKVSFRSAVEFKDTVKFSNGRTIIGYTNVGDDGKSAYVGTETIQVGKRIIVGNALMGIDAASQSITADTFSMALGSLDVGNLTAKKLISDFLGAKTLKVSDKIVGASVFANAIKANKLTIDDVTALRFTATESSALKNLVVGGNAVFQNHVRILGEGVGPNGVALVVQGGGLVAMNGIVSHTSNNKFQTMQITGGNGADHEICFHVDRKVDSLFEGDVVIDHSNLILDNSKLYSDHVVVAPLSQIKSGETINGVQITTRSNWENYESDMVSEMDAQESASEDGYDPVEEVSKAVDRTTNNYAAAQIQVDSIISPINYLMEDRDATIPKKFSVKDGLYRVDSSGNALVKNLVSETARFSKLDAYEFNVNRLKVDKLVTTGVASNVVQTDNLLESKGIANFDGSVNVQGNVFIEEGSNVNVADGASMTFRNGSELKILSGVEMNLGGGFKVKSDGTVEIDASNLVFVSGDSKYRIKFQMSGEDGVVMTYDTVVDESDRDVVQQSQRDAKELDSKLKSLGI